jgi:hypothetical protein
MLSKKILDDLTQDCPCRKTEGFQKWCFCRAVVESMEERMTMQRRLVVDHQYMMALRERREISMEEAFKDFVSSGYARTFGEAYKEGMTREELFPLVFGYDIAIPHEDEIRAHLLSN